LWPSGTWLVIDEYEWLSASPASEDYIRLLIDGAPLRLNNYTPVTPQDTQLHGILPFELVVSNLYPFEQRPDIETIDIGGPAMTRAAAKNHAWVTIVSSPDQYDVMLEELRANGGEVTEATRRAFALGKYCDAACPSQKASRTKPDKNFPFSLFLSTRAAHLRHRMC